jgi:hypothetical protein
MGDGNGRLVCTFPKFVSSVGDEQGGKQQLLQEGKVPLKSEQLQA